MLVNPTNQQDTSVDDPRLAVTITDFIIAGKGSSVIRFPTLAFQETKDGINYVVHSVFEDYLQDFKNLSIECSLTREERNKYYMKPRLLASDIYGSTELYYVILRINDMWTPKQFTLDNFKIRMLMKEDFSKAMTSIARLELRDINIYNALHVS